MSVGRAAREAKKARFFAMRMTKVSIAKAAAAVGVSRQTGYRWEDEANGTVRRAPHWEHGGRSLSLGERELVALGLARNESVQTIAAHLGRHRSVILPGDRTQQQPRR
nr:helix-turn-helix domain-containing protein [Rhodococcus aetherivorans]